MSCIIKVYYYFKTKMYLVNLILGSEWNEVINGSKTYVLQFNRFLTNTLFSWYFREVIFLDFK